MIRDMRRRMFRSALELACLAAAAGLAFRAPYREAWLIALPWLFFSARRASGRILDDARRVRSLLRPRRLEIDAEDL